MRLTNRTAWLQIRHSREQMIPCKDSKASMLPGQNQSKGDLCTPLFSKTVGQYSQAQLYFLCGWSYK